MTAPRSLDDVLNECIDRLARGETVDGCLARYPEQAEHLRSLLLTAQAALTASGSVAPRPEFRAAARHRFLDALAAHHARRREPFLTWPWLRKWGSVAAGVVALVLIGRGTVGAAEGSLPNQPLYPVKQATEAFQVALAPEGPARAKVYAELAERRLTEMVSVSKEGDVQTVERLASQMEAHLDSATRSASQAPPGGPAPAAPAALEATPTPSPTATATPTATPTPSPTPTPMPTPPAPSPTPAGQPPVAAAVPTPTPTATRPPPTATPPPPTATPPPPTATPPPPRPARTAPPRPSAPPRPTPTIEDVREVRAILKQNAEKQIAALEKALREAPPHMRPAIEKALERTREKYAQAIRKLEQYEQQRQQQERRERERQQQQQQRERRGQPAPSARVGANSAGLSLDGGRELSDVLSVLEGLQAQGKR